MTVPRWSPAHIARYQAYYASRKVFPSLAPHRWLPRVERLVEACQCLSILDYGCGPQAHLREHSLCPMAVYDPGVPAYAAEPAPADLVVCLHTFEHLEARYLPAVAVHVAACTQQVLLLGIACRDSTKPFRDGQPWHSLVQTPDAWARCLSALFPAWHWAAIAPMDTRPGREAAYVLAREPGLLATALAACEA